MILPDNNPTVKRANHTGQDERRGELDDPPGGPSLSASALDTPPPAYSERDVEETSALLPSLPEQNVKPVSQRFLKAFVAAYAILAIVASAVAGSVVLSKRRTHYPSEGTPPGDIHGYCFDFGSNDTIPKMPSSGLYSSECQFSLPLTAKANIFRSPSKSSTGNIDIVFPAELPTDSVIVRTKASHKSSETLRRASMCITHPPGGASLNYIHISQPDGDSNLDGGDIVFNVTIFLPGGNPAAPITYLSHFETDMPSFTHNFAMTDMRIRFGHVTLRSADAPIIVEGLHADDVIMTTTNATISTHMTIASGARLETSNGGISVNSEVINPSINDNSTISMIAVNGTIGAKIKLKTAGDHGGNFAVSARSTGTSMSLNFTEQPLESNLMLDASVTRGSASVGLPNTFEGDVSIFSQGFQLIEHPDITYPGDESRRRRIRTNRDKLAVSGSVRWFPTSPNRTTWGNLLLKASNGITTLLL